jgi:hypothetical protein
MTNLAKDGEKTTWARASERQERHRQALAAAGFRPAFFDFATATLYPSRRQDGSAADGHDPGGLPDAVVVVRNACGRVIATRSSLRAGYERGGYFFTRTAARRAARDWTGRA